MTIATAVTEEQRVFETENNSNGTLSNRQREMLRLDAECRRLRESEARAKQLEVGGKT